MRDLEVRHDVHSNHLWVANYQITLTYNGFPCAPSRPKKWMHRQPV